MALMETKKIDFNLDIEDGYPPIQVERLNARECGDGKYEILNSPFFAKEVAYGDIVFASESDEGRLIFCECFKESSFKAVSIIILDEKMDSEIMDIFRGHNCIIEYGEFGNIRLVAVGIPESGDYSSLKNILNDYEKSGRLSYAELVA